MLSNASGCGTRLATTFEPSIGQITEKKSRHIARERVEKIDEQNVLVPLYVEKVEAGRGRLATSSIHLADLHKAEVSFR